MASPGLLNHIVSINHVAHSFKATDHSSIVMQIDFELTTRGPGIFRCPNGMHNDPIYQQLIHNTIRMAVYDCISSRPLLREFEIGRLRHRITLEEKLQCIQKDSILEPTTATFQAWLKTQIAFLLSCEPTIEDLLSRDINVSNPALHEYVLAKVKTESLSYAKASTKEFHDNTEILKVELNELINSDDPNNTRKITDLEVQLATIEEEYLVKELEYKDNFSVLEDEKPTRNFLNLESSKGGYNGSMEPSMYSSLRVTIIKSTSPSTNKII
jgi:hypothetical protein